MGRKGKTALKTAETVSPEINPADLADLSEDGLLVIDRDYQVLFANRAIRQKVSGDLNNAPGKRCYEIIENRNTPCSFPLWKCPLGKVLGSGEATRIVHPDYLPGEYSSPRRYIEVTLRPLRNGEGDITGFAETRKDVTAERGLESYVLRHHHHLQALNRISSAVSGLWDLDQILKVSLDGVLEIIDGTIGGILLVDEESGTLSYRVHRGLSAAYIENVRLKIGEGIAGNVARTGTPALLEDISRDPRTANPDLISTEGLKGFASVPLKAKEKVVGVMNVASHEPGQFGADDLYLLGSIGYQVGTAIDQARLCQRLDRARERYRTLLQYSLTAQEEARKRIARELHDETSQVITSLALNLQALRSRLESRGTHDTEIINMFERTQRMAEHASREIVRMMKKLRPTLLDELGMAAAVNRYARDTLEPQGIVVETDFKGVGKHPVPPEVEVTLFRISQGIVGNILEHAEAKHVHIGLDITEIECTLVIRDDGKGFDPNKITRVDKDGRGAGLFIMRERVSLIGGSGSIDSAPGRGTEITIRVPLRQEDIVNGQDTGAHS